MTAAPGALSILVAGLDHPEGVCQAPDGHLYATGEKGQVYRIDLAAGSFAEIGATGGFGLGIAADADFEPLCLRHGREGRRPGPPGRVVRGLFARRAGRRVHRPELPGLRRRRQSLRLEFRRLGRANGTDPPHRAGRQRRRLVARRGGLHQRHGAQPRRAIPLCRRIEPAAGLADRHRRGRHGRRLRGGRRAAARSSPTASPSTRTGASTSPATRPTASTASPPAASRRCCSTTGRACSSMRRPTSPSPVRISTGW